MNLFYLISKKDHRFSQSRDVEIMRIERAGLVWRGIRLEAGGVLHVEKATECQPFRDRPSAIGWYAKALDAEAQIEITFSAGRERLSQRRLTVTKDSFDPILLPWPQEPFSSALDFEIGCLGPSPVFIGSHFELDRQVLIDRCRGRGVELGPGPNPHIKPGVGTEVTYVEEKSPDEWERLYGEHYKVSFDASLTPFYVVGQARNIPSPDETLDFIYSSHVFEHLANPIGHLELWSDKLRKGGEVLMVVPDYIGSRDYLAEASTLQELTLEFTRGEFTPSIHHYRSYARARNFPDKAQALYDRRSSIHAHFYTHENMRQLMEYVVDKGFYDKFTILHSKNAKDFHVILAK